MRGVKLLEPLRVGMAVAPNRLLFGPHVTNLGWDRSLSERHLAYYERRARGGAGVVVIEEASVHPSDWPYERCPLAERCAPGWRKAADTVHRHGSLALAGLGHSGGQGSSAYSQGALWAPSGVPEVNTREVPKVMEQADIDAVVNGFGDSARLATASGLDGVEVNAGQHSLVRQFLSGLTNLRGDGYGGDRLRFAREVLTATREGLGPRPVLGLRLSCDELAPWAGLTPEAAESVAVELAPLVDYLVVVRGAIFSVSATRPDLHEAPGFNLDLSARIRAAVRAATGDRVAVVAQGSIVDPDQAETALAAGAADAVEMTRAQIADPDLARKLAAGTPERVRPCLLCNQRCQVRDNRNPLVSCVVEPRSGYEWQEPEAVPDQAAFSPRSRRVGAPAVGPHAEASKGRVLVVGGGPAGLECARVAAARGHDVLVAEATGQLGGWARRASRPGGRARLALTADWLEAECRRLGVAFELDHRVRPEEVAAHPGPVVVCPGGRDREPEYEMAPGAQVLTVTAWIAGLSVRHGADTGKRAIDPTAAETGEASRTAGEGQPGSGEDRGVEGTDELADGAPVTVWDPVGGPIGVATAEELAARGHIVTLATPDFVVGTLLALSGDLAPANVRLQQAGVRLLRRVLLRRVDAGAARFEDRVTGRRTDVESALVVDCGHRWPDDETWPARRDVLIAGDAVAPRSLYEAILEGRRAALSLPAPASQQARASQEGQSSRQVPASAAGLDPGAPAEGGALSGDANVAGDRPSPPDARVSAAPGAASRTGREAP
jgi:2,4-dienoyl-CoA reductase (NADPH2)